VEHLAKPKPSEPMKTVGTVIPQSWVQTLRDRGEENLSDYIRRLIEVDISATPLNNPAEVRKRDIQTSILEICEKRPQIFRQYFSPHYELDVEEMMIKKLKEQFDLTATPSDISAAMFSLKNSGGIGLVR
jgi:hypothetical protein